MRTRHGSYPSPSDGITFFIKPKPPLKRRKISSSLPSFSSFDHDIPSSSSSSSSSSSLFDSLHDDILVSIMASLSSSAACPTDLINAMLTCKRFCAAVAHPLVLANASLSALAVSANKWCDGSHRFLRQCALSGNAEASYTLGMIRFYCFNEREIGASLMAQAAVAPHASSLHSLAIIQFNGSGGTRKDKNLKNGASLCAKAAALAHVDAMRELGHCLQDGYGVSKNVTEGRRLLLEANAREAAAAVSSSPRAFVETALQFASQSVRGRCYFRHHQNIHNNSYRSILVSKPEVSAAMAARTVTTEGTLSTSHSAQPSPPSSSSVEEVFSASRSNLEASASSGSLFTESLSASRAADAAIGSKLVENYASQPQESPAVTSPSASILAGSSRSVSMSRIVSPPSMSVETSNSSISAEPIIPHADQQPSIHLTFHHHNGQIQRQHHQYHHHHHHHLHPVYRLLQGSGCSLLSDFGCNVPPSKLHVANKFLVEWFSSHPPSNVLRLCSHGNCGRPETRRHEFRRCSACGKVNYCSRACQALDWKIRHKLECSPVADWEEREDDGDGEQHHEEDDDNEHVQDT